MSAGHLQINIRIPLPAVTYEDKRLFGIGPEDVQDLVFLMGDMALYLPSQNTGHAPQ